MNIILEKKMQDKAKVIELMDKGTQIILYGT